MCEAPHTPNAAALAFLSNLQLHPFVATRPLPSSESATSSEPALVSAALDFLSSLSLEVRGASGGAGPC